MAGRRLGWRGAVAACAVLLVLAAQWREATGRRYDEDDHDVEWNEALARVEAILGAAASTRNANHVNDDAKRTVGGGPASRLSVGQAGGLSPSGGVYNEVGPNHNIGADGGSLKAVVASLAMEPAMSPAEVEVLWRYLNADGVHSYFEFGCGGSTLLASKVRTLSEISCVDSDAEWTANVERHGGGRVTGLHVDIGPTGAWGMPTSYDYESRWWRYPTAVLGSQPDLVLVDGRFRVACALYSLVVLKQGARVLVHDYNDRPFYRAIEDFFDVEASADRIVALRRKASIDFGAWQEAVDEHIGVPH